MKAVRDLTPEEAFKFVQMYLAQAPVENAHRAAAQIKTLVEPATFAVSYAGALDKALSGMMTLRMHPRYEEEKAFAIRFTALWFELVGIKQKEDAKALEPSLSAESPATPQSPSEPPR